MPFTAATKEAAATTISGLGNYVSLHTADPGTTGANEAAGGAPAYARVQTTWAPGASDGVATGSEVTFDVPPGAYTHVGVWSASTGGTFVGGTAIPSTTLGAQGQVKVDPTLTVS